MSERCRLIVEGLGALLVILALAMVSIALGALVAGVILVLVANFYMGADDASPDKRDPANSHERREHRTD